MRWLPFPQNFKSDLNSARAIARPTEKIAALALLSGCRLSFIETIQLDRVLAETLAGADAGIDVVRLAMIGGPTLDHLLPPLRVAALRHGLPLQVTVSGYGQHRQALLDPASPLLAADPQIVLLSLTVRDLIAPLPLTASIEEVDAVLSTAVDDLRYLWRHAAGSQGRAVIQQTLLDTSPPLFGSLDRNVAAAPSRFVADLNRRIAAAAVTDGVLLLDVAQAAVREGLHFWHDSARWLLAKQEIANAAAPHYAELLASLLAALRGLSRKCLVLDLDNTLWGGVVGDDGLDGLVLGEGSAAGEAFLGVQRYAKSLLARGIVLAVCSKNDQATAEAVFDQHPEMLLRREDIAVFVANWDDKAANLRHIAKRLNLGLDSLVFVDDNPAERARVRQDLPMVAVPELPDDPAGYVGLLADASGYFESIAFTDADQDRGRQYTVSAQRDSLLESTGSMDDFLRSLNMRVAAGPFAASDLARITQLFNKTNQFNITTRRYTAAEITQTANAADVLHLQFRLEDKFGDNGLVSAMILRPLPASDEGGPATLMLENWIMSCRVFGRELEHEALNIAVEAARSRGIQEIHATFMPTAKNGVVADLFTRLGFAQIAHDTTKNAEPLSAATQWRLDVASHTGRPTHILQVKPLQ